MNGERKKILSRNIKMYRMLREMSQSDIAKRLGKSINAVSNWELGNTSPSVDELYELCKIYNTTPNRLIGWEECEELEEFKKRKEAVNLMREEIELRKSELEKLVSEYKKYAR